MDYATALAACTAAALTGVLASPARLRPVTLLFASYLFLGLWNVTGLGVLLAVTVITYLAAFAVERKPSPMVVGLAVAAILLPLVLVRFLSSAFASGATAHVGSGLLLPFGLSFFTLQGVGYVLDLYHGRVQAIRSWLPLALYLAFFPKLLAGPIERAGTFMDQLQTISLPEPRATIYAGKCILLGLFAKVVLANTLAGLGNEIMGAHSAGGALVALACAAYSYEIYLDFAGYSLIAIGVARLMGITLSENFRTPYSARTLQDFWRRWHMTLSFWFRDYLYKPLGGRQASEGHRWATVLFVFICSGLWHGSTWAFLAWGGIHGALYLIGTSTLEFRRVIWRRVGLTHVPRLHSALQTAFVFVVLTGTWVFFRTNVSDALDTLARAVGLRGGADYWSSGTVATATVILACAILFGITLLEQGRIFETLPTQEVNGTAARIGELLAIDAMIVLVLLMSAGATSFTYFRF